MLIIYTHSYMLYIYKDEQHIPYLEKKKRRVNSAKGLLPATVNRFTVATVTSQEILCFASFFNSKERSLVYGIPQES